MKYYVLAVFLLLSPSLAAATLRSVDFAYGIPLSVKEGGAVYRLSVPEEVYETVTDKNLGDVRIFNGADRVVPHILRRSETKVELSEFMDVLPFFPLYREENGAGEDDISVHIQKGEDGTIIDVESGDAQTGKDRKLSGYLIDITNHSERIDALEIVWPADADDFVTAVTVSCSNDLTLWSPIVREAALARMRYGGQEINRKRILLPANWPFQAKETRKVAGGSTEFGFSTGGRTSMPLPKVRYLRLLWPSGTDEMDVKEILAVRQSGETLKESAWTTLKSVSGSEDSEKNRTVYEYDSGACLPVDQVRLRFSEKNTLVKATFLSRPDREAKWHFRQDGIFYKLTFDQTTLVQETISLGVTSDRYWRMELAGSASGNPGNIPVVDLGWRPHELLFLAQGEGPYTLAYGSARIGEEKMDTSASGLLDHVVGGKEKTMVKGAMRLPKIVLGGPDLLVPRPPPLPWRNWLLWGVLIAGVGVIARMALSLVKGMDKTREK